MLGVFGADGKLPVDIPLLVDGVYTDDIVYPRGYGLSYEFSAAPDPLWLSRSSISALIQLPLFTWYRWLSL